MLKKPIIKTLFDAELWMAYLMQQRYKFWELHRNKTKTPMERPNTEEELTEEQQQESRRLDNEIKKFGDELHCHPLTKHLVVPWMVDIIGISESCGYTKESAQEAIEALEKRDTKSFLSQHGAIASQVRTMISNADFRITDSGGGCGSWHIGIPCTDAESYRLIDFVYCVFRNALDSGFIRMEKHYWDSRFRNLYNDNHLKNWIDKNGDPEELLKKMDK